MENNDVIMKNYFWETAAQLINRTSSDWLVELLLVWKGQVSDLDIYLHVAWNSF